MSLAAWRKAETTRGQKRHERARAALPERLRALLDGLDALDDGRQEELQRVTEQLRADHPDIAAVLDVVLTPPAQRNPSKVRAAAKRAGLGNKLGVPFPDLLRAMTVTLADNGKAATANKALRKARDTRPTMRMAVEAFTSKAWTVKTHPRVRSWSPRAEQVMALTRAGRLDWPTSDEWVRKYFVGEPVMSGERWRGAHSTIRAVQQRLDDGWLYGHDEFSEDLLDEPAAVRKLALRCVLERAAIAVPAGEYRALVGAVHAAWHLAEGLSGYERLAKQLSALDMRLSFFAGMGSSALEHLWQHVDLTEAQRTDLAHKLAKHDPTDEVIIWLLAHTNEPAALVDLAEKGSRRLDGAALRAGGVGPADVRLVLGVRAAEAGDHRRAWEHLVALCTDGSSRTGESRFQLLARKMAAADMGGTPRRRDLARVLAAALKHDLSPRTALLVLRLGATPAAVPLALNQLLRERAAGNASDSASTLCIYLWLGDRDAAAAIVRAVGKTLRRAADANARVRALLDEVYRFTDPDLAHPVHIITGPLTAFLLREGRMVLPGETGAEGMGLLRWYLAHQDRVGNMEQWAATLADAVLADVPMLAGAGHLIQPMALMALDDEPQTLGSFKENLFDFLPVGLLDDLEEMPF